MKRSGYMFRLITRHLQASYSLIKPITHPYASSLFLPLKAKYVIINKDGNLQINHRLIKSAVLEGHTIPQHLKNITELYKLKIICSSPYTKQPDNGSCSKTHQSTPHIHAVFFTIHFNIILPPAFVLQQFPSVRSLTNTKKYLYR
jgi:hypothetical protein